MRMVEKNVMVLPHSMHRYCENVVDTESACSTVPPTVRKLVPSLLMMMRSETPTQPSLTSHEYFFKTQERKVCREHDGRRIAL